MNAQSPAPPRWPFLAPGFASLVARGTLRRLWLALFLLIGLLPGLARAERYQVLTYLPAQGISQSQVTCLLQDQHGYLWVGTLNGGLNRFDGLQFRTYRWREGLAAAHIRALAEVGDTLFVGTRQGLFRKVGDRFERVPSPGEPSLDIYALAIQQGVGLVAATQKGLFRLEEKALKPDPRGKLLTPGPVFELSAGRDGSLWALHEQWVGQLKGTQFQSFTLPAGAELTQVLADPKGGAYVGSRRGIFHTGTTALEPLPILHPRMGGPITSLAMDETSTLWIGHRRGALAILEGRVKNLEASTGFPDVQVRAILQDREGNLFFGTDGSGLVQMPPQPFASFAPPPLDHYAPMDTLEDRAGRQWIATLGEGLWFVDGGRAFPVGEAQGLPTQDITRLLLSPTGTLMVGTNANGLYEVKPGPGGFKAVNQYAIPQVGVMGAVAVGESRFYATEQGLWLQEGKRFRGFQAPGDLPSSDLTDVRLTTSGNLWIGTYDMGAFLWDPSTRKVLQRLRQEDGLPSSTVTCMLEDVGGALWLGTDQGLVHKTAKGLEIFTTADGLPDDTINFITRDPRQGSLWVGTNHGVAARVDNAWRVYSTRHGLPDEETNTRSVFWDARGRLWVGTSQGYGVLEKTPPDINGIPPMVRIEQAWERTRPLELSRAPSLTYKQNSLRFHFVGLSLNDPARVRYRYRLRGLEDDGWIDTTLREVRFPALPPGEFTFEVLASNNDGVWATEPARFSFSILPPFWATWWFRSLEVLAIFLSGVLVLEVRAVRLRRQKKKLEIIVAQRTQELRTEKDKSEQLLLNILPAPIADELKERGFASPRLYADATILFTDFQDFTRMSSGVSPERLVTELDEIFAVFDDICRAHHLEKLKTIGDAFMAAGGLPVENRTHPIDAVEAALDMQEYLEERSAESGLLPFKLRIGLHTGPVVAGVIGKWKFAYDIWGDAVNVAARMESAGAAGEINISRSTFERIRERFFCEARGQVLAKGKGALEMFFVRGRKEPLTEPLRVRLTNSGRVTRS